MSDDVNYVYVKGQGWVPREPEPEPDPLLEWVPYKDQYTLEQLGYNDLVEYREELRRQAERYWGVPFQGNAVNVTTTGRTSYATVAPRYHLAVQTHDEIWYYDDPVTFTRQEPPRQLPRDTSAREYVRARYFPGSNERATTAPVEESPRDRQIREYRERVARRGRRP